MKFCVSGRMHVPVKLLSLEHAHMYARVSCDYLVG